IRDMGALAITAPAPVMERARDLVALDGAHGQVAAHMPAERVKDVQLAFGVGEYHELGAERTDSVRASGAEPVGQAQAVPAARVPGRRWSRVDGANPGTVVHGPSRR